MLRVWGVIGQGVDDTEIAALGYAQLHEGVSPSTAMEASCLFCQFETFKPSLS